MDTNFKSEDNSNESESSPQSTFAPSSQNDLLTSNLLVSDS